MGASDRRESPYLMATFSSLIRRLLAGLQATEFHTSSHLFFKRNEASSELRKMLKKLAIPLPNSVLSVTPLPEDTPET